MSRDEIRLIVFVLLALAVGSAVQWWKRADQPPGPLAPVEEPKKAWAAPPYLFKSRTHLEGTKTAMEKDGASL